MENKKGKYYRLSNETIEYLKKFATENRISITEGLEKIIKQHQESSAEFLDSLTDGIIEKFDKKYEDLFTRIRLGANAADKNSQIAIEILNAIVYEMGIQHGISTQILKSQVILDSEETVQNRIAGFRQKKLSKKR